MQTEVLVVTDLWHELRIARGLSTQRLETSALTFSRPWRQSLAAAALMVLLHALLALGLATRFGGMEAEYPRALGANQAEQNPAGIITTLILIEDPAMPVTEVDALPNTESSAVPPELSQQAQSIVTTQGEADIASDASDTGAVPRTFQEIYIGQIKARVERAWNDSQGVRLAVGTCKVNIHQGKQGEVQDVRFDDCIATEAWKTTLAQAIRYASPLPAPPDATVFSDEISLEF